jgi:hypothetical protein
MPSDKQVVKADEKLIKDTAGRIVRRLTTRPLRVLMHLERFHELHVQSVEHPGTS